MHTITLMRHGPPLSNDGRWIHAGDMARWIDQYNRAPVAPAHVPAAVPADALAVAAAAQIIVTSTLVRASTSVAALGRRADLVDPCFAEADLPHARWGGLKLPPRVWALLFRVLWLGGYRRNAASYAETRVRAAVAAQRLIVLAAQGPVLLVGHGIINRMIAAELSTRGWIGCTRPGRAHWSCARFDPAPVAQLR